jgi:hypothetical protein
LELTIWNVVIVLRFGGKINYNFMGTPIFEVVTTVWNVVVVPKVWCQDCLPRVIID